MYLDKRPFFNAHQLKKLLAMESIQVLYSSLSTAGILNIGTSLGVLSGLGLVVVASIGLGFKSLIVYYLKFDAPKDRPYNTLLLIDQVGFQLHNQMYVQCTTLC